MDTQDASNSADQAPTKFALTCAMHPTLELVRVKNFIEPDEHSVLLQWALNMRPHLNPNGPGRNFRKVQQLPAVPPVYRKIRMRVQELFGVAPDTPPEPRFGWYLSVISEGGAVHAHTDFAPPGQRHLRCNLFLQLPATGGFPIVEEQSIEVEDRMLLAFYPNEKKHSSEAVGGDRFRIICSFGFLVGESHRLPVTDGRDVKRLGAENFPSQPQEVFI